VDKVPGKLFPGQVPTPAVTVNLHWFFSSCPFVYLRG